MSADYRASDSKEVHKEKQSAISVNHSLTKEHLTA